MVRRLLTPRWLLLHALALAAMLVCFRLGWWQWDRSKDADGTFQNLGYALQWPLFGLFVPFVYWRMYTLERERVAAEPTPADVSEPAAAPTSPARRRSPTEWRAQAASQPRSDTVLAEYNGYLAELNTQDGV